MTREEIFRRFDERFQALIEEAKRDPHRCGTGISAARAEIVQERNELLEKHGFTVPNSGADLFTGLENRHH